jgi:hypothetical protein
LRRQLRWSSCRHASVVARSANACTPRYGARHDR